MRADEGDEHGWLLRSTLTTRGSEHVIYREDLAENENEFAIDSYAMATY